MGELNGKIQVSVSVVIVTFGGDTLPAVLESVGSCPAVAEVILVNNRHAPPWPEGVEGFAKRISGRFRLVHGQGNVGFGAGCNLGVARAGGTHVLLLNPDCLPSAGALERLLALVAVQPDDAWVAGPRLLKADGTEQSGGRCNAGTPEQWLGEAFGGPFAARWGRVNLHRQPVPAGDLVEVPAICGAFMLMPTTHFRRLDGFDPGYFLYFEDLALCRAVRRTGGRVLFAPSVTAVHPKGCSPVPRLVVVGHKIRSFRRYLFTEFVPEGVPRWRLWGLWVLLSAGLLARTLLTGPAFRRISRRGRVMVPGHHPVGRSAEPEASRLSRRSS
jgi:GT2 family glycosyltransferase